MENQNQQQPAVPEMETGVVKIEEFKSLISNAPAVLEENKTSSMKAIARGNDLLAQSMNEGTYNDILAYIDKAKKTVVVMNNKRKPFTQIMTMVAKTFTSVEAEVADVVAKCQERANEYATKIMEERKEKERQAQLKLQKETELIDLEKDFKIQYAGKYSDYLLDYKTRAKNWFNNLTLENIDGATAIIAGFNNNLSDSKFIFKTNTPNLTLVSESEYNQMTDKARMGQCYACLARFKQDIVDFMRELSDMVPSKKQQLEEQDAQIKQALKEQEEAAERQRIADQKAAETKRLADLEADEKRKAELIRQNEEQEKKAEEERQKNIAAEAERKRLKEKAEEEERQRQAEEKEKLKLQSEEKRLADEAKVQVEAAGNKAAAMVDTQAALFTEAPKIKEGYSIEILNPAAYLLLVQFWFENEGKNLSQEKIESMTFARIKAFCEKYATKNEVKIQSGLINYKPVYKAK